MLLNNSVRIHRWLRYLAVLGLVLFVVSALMHPIMIWTGPQPSRMVPPSMSIHDLSADKISHILTKYHIELPLLVKLVPTAVGTCLQVTEQEDLPRRYFNLQSGEELEEFDRQQAIWLSQYYTNDNDYITKVEFITEFNDEYPWVNRLLPVYKITFDSKDNTVVYVYTETNALAAINNDWKDVLQFVFRNFHTWSWLDAFPILRIILTTFLLIALIAMTATGVMQLFLKKSTLKTPRRRESHRIVATIVFIPLVALLISGLFHLQFQQFGESRGGMRMSESLSLESNTHSNSPSAFDYENQPINNVSLIEYQNKLFYRIGFSPKHNSEPTFGHHAIVSSDDLKKREQRFDGISPERSSVYIDVANGQLMDLEDKTVATSLAAEFLGRNQLQINKVELVTHFGPEYDFRNKRLPVWRIDANNPEHHIIFVDPITSIVVDHLTPLSRLERWSFSMLHKWDFLVPFMGRQVRDMLVITLLTGLLLLAYLGISMTRFRNSLKK